jgi:hypothetical protein
MANLKCFSLQYEAVLLINLIGTANDNHFKHLS